MRGDDARIENGLHIISKRIACRGERWRIVINAVAFSAILLDVEDCRGGLCASMGRYEC